MPNFKENCLSQNCLTSRKSAYLKIAYVKVKYQKVPIYKYYTAQGCLAQGFTVHSKWMVPVYTFGFLSWGLNHFIKRKFWKISLFHIELTFMWVGTIKKILTHQVLLNRNLAIMLVDDSTKDKILAPKRSPRYPPTSATKLSNG